MASAGLIMKLTKKRPISKEKGRDSYGLNRSVLSKAEHRPHQNRFVYFSLFLVIGQWTSKYRRVKPAMVFYAHWAIALQAQKNIVKYKNQYYSK